jgi:hypothetical protein
MADLYPFGKIVASLVMAALRSFVATMIITLLLGVLL